MMTWPKTKVHLQIWCVAWTQSFNWTLILLISESPSKITSVWENMTWTDIRFKSLVWMCAKVCFWVLNAALHCAEYKWCLDHLVLWIAVIGNWLCYSNCRRKENSKTQLSSTFPPTLFPVVGLSLLLYLFRCHFHLNLFFMFHVDS